MEKVTKANDETLTQLLQTHTTPAVIDFGAAWCNPCKKLEPIYNDLASSLGDKFTFYKVDIDESPNLVGSYDIEGVPTLVVVKDGKVVAKRTGFYNLANLQSWLTPFSS